MKLSAPIYVLKSRAKVLKKAEGVSFANALDTVARQEGFATWSLLMSKRESLLPESYSDILDFLNEGDLVLVGARPRVGKTTFAFGLIAQAIEAARPKSHVFTLVEREHDSQKRLGAYADSIGQSEDLCWIDCSDDVSAEYIVDTARDRAKPGSLIVVDYLQVLDERRSNPPLQDQISRLKEFAKTTGCIVVILSQLDRRIGDREDQRPTVADIRLPNPVDLDLFNKIILLYRESAEAEEAEVSFASPLSHNLKVGLDRQNLRFFDLA